MKTNLYWRLIFGLGNVTKMVSGSIHKLLASPSFSSNSQTMTYVGYETFTHHVRRIINRFRDTGSVSKDNTSPGKRLALNEKTLEDIQERLEESPNKSLRRLCAQTGLSYETCQMACRKKLHMHPYKVSVAASRFCKVTNLLHLV